ncbi:Nucleoside recognition [Bacteroidales bacterium Barb7]|nr:Nucleoside recognition [Bacteroidales bacterium Barb7]
MADTLSRSWKCVLAALPKAGRTCVWLLKIILPVSLLVMLLQYFGWLETFSVYLSPVFSAIGLPAETAVIFLTSCFCPLYTSIALIATTSLGLREATILALMCLTSHNLIVESTIQGKTGSTFWGMNALRIGMAFVIAFALNRVMPTEGWGYIGVERSVEAFGSLREVFTVWFTGAMQVIITILLVVTSLLILHGVLEEFKLMKGLSAIFTPLMRVFGLPKDTAFLWLVGNVVGLAYGGAIMMEQLEQKKLSYKNSNLLNYHLAVSHSLLEDTIVFAAIGIPVLWILCTRLLFAAAVVWIRRGIGYASKTH